jgi:hypothetical protein
MSGAQVLWAIITGIVAGLIATECSEISSWTAHRLVRWSAHHQHPDPTRAEVRAEEFAEYINNVPGKLFKLAMALFFVVTAVLARSRTRRVASTELTEWKGSTELALIRQWEPRPPHGSRMSAAQANNEPKVSTVHQAWELLRSEVRRAAAEAGVGSRSWRRCLTRLRKATGDERWAVLAERLGQLSEFSSSCGGRVAGGGTPGPGYEIIIEIPTDSAVASYLAATQVVRDDLRQLTESRVA